jgi:ceramide synthetase
MATLAELFMGSYSSSAPVDWEAEAYPTYGDYSVLPFLVAFFPACRFLLDRFIFEVNCFWLFFFLFGVPFGSSL